MSGNGGGHQPSRNTVRVTANPPWKRRPSSSTPSPPRGATFLSLQILVPPPLPSLASPGTPPTSRPHAHTLERAHAHTHTQAHTHDTRSPTATQTHTSAHVYAHAHAHRHARTLSHVRRAIATPLPQGARTNTHSRGSPAPRPASGPQALTGATLFFLPPCRQATCPPPPLAHSVPGVRLGQGSGPLGLGA